MRRQSALMRMLLPIFLSQIGVRLAMQQIGSSFRPYALGQFSSWQFDHNFVHG